MKFALILSCFLLTGCGDYNWFGLLTKPPVQADLVGSYKLTEWSSKYVGKMGYSQFDGTITLHNDWTYSAVNIPATCVHGLDENTYAFSGGYYAFSGNWSVAKSSAVYVVKLTLDMVHSTGVPSEAELKQIDPQRTVFNSMQVHIMKGTPYSLGFPVFNGDFFEIEFSRINPNRVHGTD